MHLFTLLTIAHNFFQAIRPYFKNNETYAKNVIRRESRRRVPTDFTIERTDDIYRDIDL